MPNPQDNEKLDPEEWHQRVVQMREQGMATLSGAINKLEKLLESVDASRLLVSTIANMSFGPEGSISELTHGDVPAKVEILAYYAYPYFGKSLNKEITPWHISDCIKSLDDILALRLIVPRLPKDSRELDAIDKIVANIRAQAEVVRGSAYPEQTASEIVSIQGHFEEWFRKTIGIGSNRAQAILWSIIRIQEETMNSILPDIRSQVRVAGESWLKIKSKPSKDRSPAEARMLDALQDQQTAEVFELAARICAIGPDTLPVSFEDIKDVEPAPSSEEWESLIKLIGMTTESRMSMSEAVDVRRRPLFVLPDNRVILVDLSNALDTLWESYEQVAKTDQKFFSGEYQRKRAEWLEQRIVSCLANLFPSKHIFRNLTYPDPDKNDGSTTELDVAVQWGPFLVLVEAKAKQFRLESQLGDAGRLRSDIKANVEDAFDQARRAVRYLDQTANPEFIESSSSRRLNISKENIRRIYLITVSQHLLAGLATRLSMFKDIGLFRDGEYPLSISVADLEIITQFCDGPDVLLHYVEKRLAVQKESLNILADELDFFGAYLKTRLQSARLWGNEGVEPNAIWLHGFSSQFDDWIAYKRGDLSTRPSIELEILTGIKAILEELRKRDDYASRWIAFALLDMSDGIHHTIDEHLAELRTAELIPGMFRRWTGADADIVVSIVGSLDLPLRLLEQRTEMRAVLEKYRHKAPKSIGLGIMIKDKSRPFHCAIWVEHPWEHDDEIEELIRKEPPFKPAPGTKLPGRNDPCLCGSGKKFKKCCLTKIQSTGGQ